MKKKTDSRKAAPKAKADKATTKSPVKAPSKAKARRVKLKNVEQADPEVPSEDTEAPGGDAPEFFAINDTTIIVIPPDAGRDPEKIYAIPKEVYTDPKYELAKPAAGIVRGMVKYGAAFGYIPSAGIGIGSMCYLVNLRSLRKD